MQTPFTHFLAVGPCCWGKALTIEAALRRAKHEMPDFVRRGLKVEGRKAEFAIYGATSREVWVDDFGNVRADAGVEVTRIQ